MVLESLPENFLRYNDQRTKNLSVVVEIDGLDLLSSTPVFTRLRYGDVGLFYGQADHVYGGLRRVDNARDLLALGGESGGSGLTISQRIEPEQGRGSVSTISLSFIDKDGYMTQATSDGVLIDTILNKEVKVWLGFKEISFPEDFFIIFRGRVSSVTNSGGLVTLQLSDPNLLRRKQLFFTAKTTLTQNFEYNSLTVQNLRYSAKYPHDTDVSIVYTGGGVRGSESVSVVGNAISVQIENGGSTAQDIEAKLRASDAAMALVDVSFVGSQTTGQVIFSTTFLVRDTTVHVVANTDFHQQILGPNGAYDSAITTYLKIGDEYIEYPAGSILGSTQFVGCIRGARGSEPVGHSAGDEVEAVIQIQDHGLDMALKLMLSGWQGPYLLNVQAHAFVATGDVTLGDIPGAIILPEKKDADRDYGLQPGDYVTVTGATNPANNGTFQIQFFSDLFEQPNRVIHVNSSLTHEATTSAVMSFRSQFDTYPDTCGLRMSPTEIDVEQHVGLKNIFLGGNDNRLRFLLSSQESQGKTFIESELYLPLFCYSLTRQGRLSVGFTKPPIADQRLQILDKNNILNPQTLNPTFGLNNRKFFNDIQYQIDLADDDHYETFLRFLDGESFNKIKTTAVLPIKSRGAKTDLGYQNGIARKNSFVFSRYKDAATMIDVKVTWGSGVQIEAGDVVAVKDNGDLQIPNRNTGERSSGVALYEVIDRSFDIKQGVSLKLIAGISSDLTDRYATIAPSSLVAGGSTTSTIKIQDSFGSLFPGNEKKKWKDYIGLNILVHNKSYSQSATVTLTGFVPGNDYLMTVEPALPWVPSSGFVVDLAEYSGLASLADQQLAKLVHAFLDASVTVTSGSSATQFSVGGGDVSKFQEGFPILIHNANYSTISNEVKVLSVAGTLVTVDSSLGFTPSAGQKVEFLGFADGGGPYRFI